MLARVLVQVEGHRPRLEPLSAVLLRVLHHVLLYVHHWTGRDLRDVARVALVLEQVARALVLCDRLGLGLLSLGHLLAVGVPIALR